jgi:hypothetical protein
VRSEIVLPAFEMDCREWIVLQPGEAGFPGIDSEDPIVAVLSTAVIAQDELHPLRAVLSLALLEEEGSAAVSGSQAQVIDYGERMVVYLLPTPDGRLALLAEFTLAPMPSPESGRRIEALMDSFRWSA